MPVSAANGADEDAADEEAAAEGEAAIARPTCTASSTDFQDMISALNSAEASAERGGIAERESAVTVDSK